MGSWRLEVGKMAMYTMFPVVLFHYFNQPAYFEQWVTETKRKIMPPEKPEDRESVRQLVQTLREKQLRQLSE